MDLALGHTFTHHEQTATVETVGTDQRYTAVVQRIASERHADAISFITSALKAG